MLDHLTPKQQKIASEAYDWGYGTQNIHRRKSIWQGKKILDIGMGGGPHSIPFIVGGAQSYVGVDPKIGTETVRDLRSDKKPDIPAYHAFPFTPHEIMDAFCNITLIPGTLENNIEQIRKLDVDIVILSTVTEHLRHPDVVIEAAFEACRKGAMIWLSHGNYYSWFGHHLNPRSVEHYDPQNADHIGNVDWQHLDPDHSSQSNENLNRMRLNDLKDLIDKFFEIKEWFVQIEAKERLTPELRGKYKRFSDEELLGRMIYVCAERREKAKDIDLSEKQFFHPDQSYMQEKDYSKESSINADWSNLVFFTADGALASHTYNNHAAKNIILSIKNGDSIIVQKYPHRLSLTVKTVSKPENGNPSVTFHEELPWDIIEEEPSEWVILQHTSRFYE